MKRDTAVYQIGDSVMVKEGVIDPDDEEVEIGGWQGRIVEIDGEDEDTRSFLVQWDGPTLRGITQSYIAENLVEGLDWSTMYFEANAISPAAPRDTVEEAEAALLEVTERFVDNLIPPAARDALAEYAQIREQLMEFNNSALGAITAEEMVKAAKQLGLLKEGGVFSFNSEEEMSALADFALYELRRDGIPIIQWHLRVNPDSKRKGGLGSKLAGVIGSLLSKDEATPILDAAVLDEAISQSFTSMFQIDLLAPEGLTLVDLLNPKRPPYRLMDIGLMSTAEPKMLIFTRLLPIGDFHITTGAAFCFPASRRQHLLTSYRNAVQGRRGHGLEVERYRFFHRANLRFGLEMWYN